MERKSIGSFIAVLRKANGLTQRELAEKLGVSDKAVSRWERDETAPDLYLIPVIAEIFGVTSDELLRGERAGESAVADEKQTEKTERQIKTVLKTVRTKFLTKTLICALIAIVGLLAAMLCNFGFYRAELGFYIGIIFYVTSAVIEIIFAVLALSSLDSDEFNGEHMAETRKYIIKKTEAVIFFAFILLAYSLPLIIDSSSLSFVNIRVDFDGWLVFGGIFAIIAGIICSVANIILDKTMEAKSIYTVDEKTVNKRRLAKIRFISPIPKLAKVFAPIIAVTVAVHIVCLNVFTYEFFLRGKGKEWTDPNAFVEYMETRVQENGAVDEDDRYTIYPRYSIHFKTPDGIFHISFRWNNHMVADFNINGVSSSNVESGINGTVYTQIYPSEEEPKTDSPHITYDIPGFHAVTYSCEEAFDARDWAYDIHVCFVLAYISEGLALVITYSVMVIKKFKETKE